MYACVMNLRQSRRTILLLLSTLRIHYNNYIFRDKLSNAYDAMYYFNFLYYIMIAEPDQYDGLKNNEHTSRCHDKS